MGNYGKPRLTPAGKFIRDLGYGLLIAAVIGILVAMGQLVGVGPFAK